MSLRSTRSSVRTYMYDGSVVPLPSISAPRAVSNQQQQQCMRVSSRIYAFVLDPPRRLYRSGIICSLLGFIGALQVLSLLMCVHLLRWRKWPPYVTKNVSLVVITVSALDVLPGGGSGGGGDGGGRGGRRRGGGGSGASTMLMLFRCSWFLFFLSGSAYCCCCRLVYPSLPRLYF